MDVLAQAASVVEGLDEVGDAGAGGRAVRPEAGDDLLFEYSPKALRGGHPVMPHRVRTDLDVQKVPRQGGQAPDT